MGWTGDSCPMVGEARRFTRGRQRSSAGGKLSDNGGREVLVTDVEGTMTRVGKVNQDLIPNAMYYGGKGDEALWRGVESDCLLGNTFINANSKLESGVKI